MGQVRPHHLGKVLRNFRGRQAAACRGRGGIHAPTTKIFQALQHDFFEFCKLYPSYWTFLVVSCLCCKIVKNVGSNELHHITSCRKTFGSSTNKEIDLFFNIWFNSYSIHIPSIFHIISYPSCERPGHSICAAWSLEIIAPWEKMPLEPHGKILTDFESVVGECMTVWHHLNISQL